MLDHLIPREKSILFAPLDELDIELERARPVPTIDGFTHEQFMADRNQEGWLAWNLTRPLQIPPKHKATMPMAVAQPVPVKKKRGRR